MNIVEITDTSRSCIVNYAINLHNVNYMHLHGSKITFYFQNQAFTHCFQFGDAEALNTYNRIKRVMNQSETIRIASPLPEPIQEAKYK